MIELRDVSKIYQIGDERVHALDHANLHVRPKEFVSIIGPSGSGKSTLMNIIGCLDVADAGEYLLDGMPIEAYSENDLAEIRNRKIGFVFQSFNLIPKLTAEKRVNARRASARPLKRSGSRNAPSTCPPSSRAGSSSVSPSPGPW